QQGRSYGVGYDKVHVAIDDATRLAYVEVLPDEKAPTTVGFLSRAVAWFNSQGIECRRVLSDIHPGCIPIRSSPTAGGGVSIGTGACLELLLCDWSLIPLDLDSLPVDRGPRQEHAGAVLQPC
ncbi:hypothetical protein ACLNEE_16700, partial [Aphanothece stagnina RSMan2012]